MPVNVGEMCEERDVPAMTATERRSTPTARLGGLARALRLGLDCMLSQRTWGWELP
jgi:hypothetical protein